MSLALSPNSFHTDETTDERHHGSEQGAYRLNLTWLGLTAEAFQVQLEIQTAPKRIESFPARRLGSECADGTLTSDG